VVEKYALAKQSPLTVWIRPANSPSLILGQLTPPADTANQDGLGVLYVKPYCLISGSFPNLLVYLPRTRGVKKAPGMVMGRGKVIHPGDLWVALVSRYSEFQR
jgi:hypothetical protein